MNRLSNVFLVSAFACSFAFSQTTNLVGVNLFGDGDFPDNHAATVSDFSGMFVTNSSFTGGGGAASIGRGGVGLDADEIKSSTLIGSEFTGGEGGPEGVRDSGSDATLYATGGTAFDLNGFSEAYASPGDEQVRIQDSSFTGGAGGNIAIEIEPRSDVSGGAGALISKVVIHVDSGDFQGGKGGTIDGAGASLGLRAKADGGDGLETGTDGFIQTLNDNVKATGGDGGSISGGFVDGNLGSAVGGNGITSYGYYDGYGYEPKVLGGIFQGGSGGTIYNTGTVALNGGDVSGGAGYYMSVETAVISNGTFKGGNAGSVTGLQEDSLTDGGAGMYVTDNDTLYIYGGTFEGGQAGKVNGVITGSRGAGLHLNDTYTLGSIYGGNFNGLGLLMESTFVSSALDIYGGTFEETIFNAAVGKQNTVGIEGGTFESILLQGDGINEMTISGTNSIAELTLVGSGNRTVTSSGYSIGKLSFEGSGENTVDLSNAMLSSVSFNGTNDANTLNITDNGMAIDKVDIYGGSADISFNNTHEINDIYVSDATLTVTGSDLEIGVGKTYQVVGENSLLDTDQNLTVMGSLDVGAGSVIVGSALMAKSGSTLRTVIAADGEGIKGGTITAETADFEEGVSWKIVNDGSVVNTSSLNDGVLLASANVNAGITHAFDESGSDFDLIGNPSVLLGINGVSNFFNATSSKQELRATYGVLTIDNVLDDYPDMKAAMDDLALVVDNDEALEEYISQNWQNLDTLVLDFSQSFIRTPEMGSALMGLQGVFADQVRNRTRSNLSHKQFGRKTSAAPAGARGPEDWYDNSVQWGQDHAPAWDAKGATRTASGNAPKIDYDGAVDSMNNRTQSSSAAIEVPDTYSVWGRAYGSKLDQGATKGHTGYDASTVGGVIGVDKRYEDMLIGLGAGYAKTRLTGNGGNDGDADTAYAMGYFSHSSDSVYFDATLNYAYNDVATEGVSTVGYEAEYDASTVGIGIGTGYGMSFYKDRLLFTPEASYLGSYYTRGEYTEKSNLATPFPDKEYESYSQWSHLTSIGATLTTMGVLDYFNADLVYQPELRAHWLHEFNADMDDDSYVMVGGAGDPLAVALQAREEDLIRLGAGISFSKWDNNTTEFGFDIDGAFGGEYQNFIVSGKILHRF